MNDYVVVARTPSDGPVRLNNTLTMYADGALRFSEHRFGRDESGEAPPEGIRPHEVLAPRVTAS